MFGLPDEKTSTASLPDFEEDCAEEHKNGQMEMQIIKITVFFIIDFLIV